MCDQCKSGESCINDWLGDGAGKMMGVDAPVPISSDAAEVVRGSRERVLVLHQAAAKFMELADCPELWSDDHNRYLLRIVLRFTDIIASHKAGAGCFADGYLSIRMGDGIEIICPSCHNVIETVEV